ncbi:MAG: recombinase family protein [Acidobacteriia bacterium]|nr:recombinase family protein [Terriglobia bacterium]
MKPKRAAVYVRVSTPEQDTGLQETELREYVESRGWNYFVYRDQGQSGAKNDRPALTAMLNDVRKRKADVVVVWALDRLARSLKHLLAIAEGSGRLRCGTFLKPQKQSVCGRITRCRRVLGIKDASPPCSVEVESPYRFARFINRTGKLCCG